MSETEGRYPFISKEALDEWHAPKDDHWATLFDKMETLSESMTKLHDRLEALERSSVRPGATFDATRQQWKFTHADGKVILKYAKVTLEDLDNWLTEWDRKGA